MGIVRELGGGAGGFAVGEQVAWCETSGSYAELVAVPAAQAVRVATRQELECHADAVFAAVTESTLDVRIGHRYPLAEAARAHRDLQGRQTTGKLILQP